MNLSFTYLSLLHSVLLRSTIQVFKTITITQINIETSLEAITDLGTSHPKSDYPTGEHPTGEHPTGEHPIGGNPTGCYS